MIQSLSRQNKSVRIRFGIEGKKNALRSNCSTCKRTSRPDSLPKSKGKIKLSAALGKGSGFVGVVKEGKRSSHDIRREGNRNADFFFGLPYGSKTISSRRSRAGDKENRANLSAVWGKDNPHLRGVSGSRKTGCCFSGKRIQ